MNYLDDLTPALERLWIDEVRRLHALWHLGPPRDHATSGLHAPCQTTSFKREEPNKQKAKRRHKNKIKNKSVDIEWPCEPETLEDRSADGFRSWDDVCSSRPAPAAIPLSAERLASIAASQAQKDGISASKEFFTANCSSDWEEDEAMYDEDHQDGDDIESRCFEFFLDLFEKDGKLKGYYKKNWEKGEFCCLVCLGIREKLSKKYGDCVSLVQHSNSILNTKGRRAHRAFVRVLCQVLVWDISRLPTIITNVSKQPGEAGEKSD